MTNWEWSDDSDPDLIFLKKERILLIQLCVVFEGKERKKERKEKNLSNIPMHSFNITNNAYKEKYIQICHKLYSHFHTHLQIDHITNVTWPLCQNDKIDKLTLQ